MSKFIEDAIDKLYDEPDTKKLDLDITKIVGAFGKAPKNFDWKKIKTEYLLKKYVKQVLCNQPDEVFLRFDSLGATISYYRLTIKSYLPGVVFAKVFKLSYIFIMYCG